MEIIKRRGIKEITFEESGKLLILIKNTFPNRLAVTQETSSDFDLGISRSEDDAYFISVKDKKRPFFLGYEVKLKDELHISRVLERIYDIKSGTIILRTKSL